MELQKINQNNVNTLDYINSKSVSSSNKVEETSDVKSSTIQDIVAIEPDSQTRSNFTNSLKSDISKLSNLQTTGVQLRNQVEIIDEIDQLMKQAENSVNATQTLDDIQPKVKQLMDNFNHTASKINVNTKSSSINNIEEELSHVFFDGIMGSKPLSLEEIKDTTNMFKQDIIKAEEKSNEEYNNTVNQAHETIKIEKSVAASQSPLKSVDFGKESVDFNNNTLNSVIGNVSATQANASPLHSIELLA